MRNRYRHTGTNAGTREGVLPEEDTRVVLTELEAGQLLSAVRIALEMGRCLEVDTRTLQGAREKLLAAFVLDGRISLGS